MGHEMHGISGGFAAIGLAALIGCCATQAPAQQSAPAARGDARVDALLGQMTLEEKLSLIHGAHEDAATNQGQAGYLAGVPRLGIPPMRFADGTPCVLTREPSAAETATMGVAATFSVKDAEDNGAVVGREARSLGIDVSLQPFVNIDRDLQFERGYNTFGEDPFLTGRIGAAEIRGIQGQHVMAQVKHYVGYDSGGNDITIDDQTLHEVYVAPFDAAVHAGVASMMCSYNRINGAYACGNSGTLTDILRKQIGFKGFVTSDWGATHAVDFINAGLDMEMPGPATAGSPMAMDSYFDSQPAPAKDASAPTAEFFFGGHLPEEPGTGAMAPPGGMGAAVETKKMPEALKDGTVNEARVTEAARRVLYEMDRFGYLDGQSKHTVTAHQTDTNAKIIEKTGEDAAVLLKNEGHALPLKADQLADTVLIGPGARQVFAIGTSGERSVGLPEREIGPYDAMRKIGGNTQIGLAVEDDWTGVPVPSGALSHDGKPGLERAVEGQAAQADASIDFTVKGGNALPAGTRAAWTGTLTIAKAGEYWIYLQGLGANAGLKIDGKTAVRFGATQGGMHGDILQANQDSGIPTTDLLDDARAAVQLSAGAHEVELKISPDSSGAAEQVRLNWYTPEARAADHAAAIEAARRAKTAVVFLWTRGNPVFGLPGDQNKLVEEVAAVNPNTIVVLNVSQPVALPWLDKVKAVLLMWWPGDEGGWATANLLLGKVSPAGRLPFTWGRRLEDYAATDPRYPERTAKGVNGKTTFSEGVNVGYRWFDKEKTEPLFPFGFGLSYTSFDYSKLQVRKSMDGGLDVAVTVRNSGQVASDEVPQVYLGAPDKIPAGVQFAVRSLVAFHRVSFAPGEEKTVRLHVDPRQMEYWSTAQGTWVMPPGKRTLSVGASSRDLRLSAAVGGK